MTKDQVACGTCGTTIQPDTLTGSTCACALAPNTLGAVDYETRRVCIGIADYADSDLNGDAAAYWLTESSRQLGLDPWALVEGVDARLDGKGFDVWFANGKCLAVGQDGVMYLSAKDAATLARPQHQKLTEK